MSSACSIAPAGVEPVTDPETGEVTFPAGEAVYVGKCRVRPVAAVGGDTDAGGAELARLDYLISVPFSVTGVKEGHRVTITASPDVSLVGAVVEVRRVDRGDHITARRLQCEEVA